MTQPHKTPVEEEITLKDILRILHRYRYMIIFFILIFGLVSGYIAYFKPNIYKAVTTVEVGLGKGDESDIVSKAIEPGRLIADTEKEIIRSRYLAEKALKKVDFTHRYYTTRNLREIELYKDSPFEVGMLKGYGVSFNLYPVDDKHYRLEVENAVDQNGTAWQYDKVHLYGDEVVNKHFHLNVVRTGRTADDAYRFVISRKNRPAGSVSVAQMTRASTILHITYEENVPLRAQEYSIALAEAYITQNIEKKTKQASLQLGFLDKQLNEITENLKGSAVKIEEFKKSANTVSLSTKAENIIRKMSDAEAKLEAIRIESEMLENLYKQVKKGKNLETISVAGMESSGSAALSDKIAQLQDAIIKKKLLREDYTEMYPGVIKLRKQIAELKKIIISTISNLRENLKEKQDLLKKSIARYQKELNEIPADERMYGQLQRKFAVNEKIYSYLLEKRSETAIVKASTVSKNRIIDRSLLPSSPVKPKRILIVLIGIVLGLILGIVIALVRYYFDDTLQSEEELETMLGETPLLGAIPHIKQDSDKLKVLLSPKSALAESFRNLRTNLQFMNVRKKSHVIAVTSTISGEGKTTICVNLAAIMSIADKKTIIVNLDMRKPTLHEKFGLSNVQGMSTLLSHASSLGSVIQKTEYSNLDVITSGPIPPNPSELIQGDFIEKVIEKLREVYDVIVIDTPPIGLVTDARTLMHLADTSIYVLRAGYSKRGFLSTVRQLSAMKEIHGLSIVLNDVKADRHGYGYGYGYGYGKGYGYYEDEKK